MAAGNMGLTPRTLQIIPLVAQGLSNRAIAQSLGISESTMKVHVKRILRTLGLRNRTHLAVWWWHHQRTNNLLQSAKEHSDG